MVELFKAYRESGSDDRLQQVRAVEPEGLPVIPGRPAVLFSLVEALFGGELGSPAPPIPGGVLFRFGQAVLRVGLVGGKVGLEDPYTFGDGPDKADEFNGPVEMVEQPAAEDDIGLPVTRQVPG